MTNKKGEKNLSKNCHFIKDNSMPEKEKMRLQYKNTEDNGMPGKIEDKCTFERDEGIDDPWNHQFPL